MRHEKNNVLSYILFAIIYSMLKIMNCQLFFAALLFQTTKTPQAYLLEG